MRKIIIPAWIVSMLFVACDLLKKTDVKNENLQPKILIAKLKGDTMSLKNYQFTIDTLK